LRVNEISATKNTDRYNFHWNFGCGTSDKGWYIDSNRPIQYVENSPYKGHFIILGEDGIHGNWIDFEGLSGTPVITRYLGDDNHYYVFFKDAPANVTFNSIGSLNVFQQDTLFTFYDIYTRNLNISFKDNVSNILINEPTISFNETFYYIFNPVQINYTSFNYSTLPNSTYFHLTFDKFGYQSFDTYINLSNYQIVNNNYNLLFNVTMSDLTLIFTSQTTGIIETPDLVQFFNATAISIPQTNISEGYVTIVFNPDGTGKYQQLYKYYNDLNTTIHDNILIQTVDLVQQIRVSGSGQPLENARVCAKMGYDTTNEVTVKFLQ